jgi:hypothetical protein
VEAVREIRSCERALAKTGDTLLTELLRGQGTAQDWCHYPPGDVYDAEYHAQYYYHCHPPAERKPGEHGHFHTFLRPFGMPDGVSPVPLPDFRRPADVNDALSHLIGIGMSSTGEVVRLFTTNRWVTGETWYAAADVVRMLDCFVVDHARPSWPLNRWITAVLRLFRPQIIALLHQRDAALSLRSRTLPQSNAYDDRGLEIPSEIDVSTTAMAEAVEQAWRQRKRRTAGRPDGNDADCQSVSSVLT